MEEKYSFADKKLALEKYIQTQNKKNYVIRQIKDLRIRKKSDTCLYCGNNTIEQELFCSFICKSIFFSNMNKIIPTVCNQIRFVPFEIIKPEAKEIFKKFVQEERIYDKFQVYYSLVKEDKKVVVQSVFKFILNFEISEIKNLNLELNYYYISDVQKIDYISLENGMPNQFEHICLYCKCHTTNHTIKIDKHYLIGHICSVFCYKSFMTFLSNHINFPFKYFFSLPCINMLEQPEQLLKHKNKKENYENTVFETEYYTNNKENLFTVNMVTY
ncbi:putative viral late transcription factor 2 [Yalta virus]|nr:putative viral late transcription factor 2 [Yalta virus]